MVSSRDLEDYLKWEHDRNSFFVNIQKSMSPTYVIFLLAIVALAIYLLSSSGTNKTIVYIGLVVLIIAVIWRSKKKERTPIEEPVIKVIVMMNMERSIGKEYPAGSSVSPLPYCHRRVWGTWGEIFHEWKWEVGVKIRYPDYREEDLLVTADPYEGHIIGKVKKPEGYTGEISNDLKLVPVNFFVDSKPKETVK